MASVGIASAAPPTFISSPGNSTINEDGSITVFANVSDADGDLISLSAASGNTTIIPNGGLVVTPSGLAGNGLRTITITPAANQWGSPTLITLTAVANFQTASASFSITVDSVNDAPVVTDDSASVTEDGTLSGSSVLSNDSDLHSGAPGENNTPLTAVLDIGPSHGTLSLGSSGTYTYTPDPNYYGADSFTYRAQDSLGGLSSIATVSITITEDNDPPVATDDAIAAINEDSGDYTISFASLLGNDSTGPENESAQTLTISSVGPAVGGAVSIVGTDVVFSPTLNFNGPASFDYVVADDGTTNGLPAPLSDTGLVNFTINAVNDAPVAVGDSYSTDEDVTLNVSAPGVLSNDSDVDLDTLTTELVADVTNGTLTLNANGSFSYVPDADFSGSDSFTYNATDSLLDSNVVTVSITVDAVNDAPTISDVADQSTNEDTATGAIAITVGDVDNAAAGLVVTASSSNQALVTDANLVLGGSGTSRTVVATPEADANGTTTITLTVSDGDLTATDTFVLTVNAVNDAPVAVGDSYSTDEDITLNVSAPGVLGNDSDVDLDALTTELVSNVSNGTLTLNANGSFSYVPDADFSGSDSFTYNATDSLLDSNVVTVSITVDAVNDAPTISDVADQSTNEDTATGAIGITVGDVDNAAAGLVVTASSSNQALVTDANLVLGGSGTGRTLVATPEADANGTTTITLTVSDGNLTATDTFVLTVNAVNDAPVAVGDSYSTDEDITLNVSAPGVLGNDSDVDLDALTTELVSNVSNGTLTLNANGSFSYVPDADFSGSDSFTYNATDSLLDSNVVTVSITVDAVNDAPTISDVADQSTNEDTATGAIGITVGDVDNAAAGLVVTASSSNQALVTDANLVLGGSGTGRTLVATPEADANGTTTITLTVSDGNLTATDTFVLTVNAVNDAPVFEIFPSDILAMNEDTSLLTINGTALALRVVDPEGDALTVAAVSGNQYLLPNANLGIQGSGNERTIELTLAPDKNSATSVIDSQSGFVTVSVTAFDINGASTIEDFLIQSVTPVDDAPSFVPGGVQTVAEDAGAQSTAWATSFRYGPNTATDETSQTVVQYTLTPVPGGTVTFAVAPSINNSGVLTYTTALNAFGTAAFEVRVIDSGSNVAPNVNTSAAQTLVINVTPINDAPVADNGSATLAEDGAAAITLTASDVDDAPGVLTYAVATPPANGSLSGTAPNLTYTPNANFNGGDSFTFTASDDDLATSTPATITITVTEVNDAPVAGDDSVADVLEDAPMFSTSAATLLGNDGNGGGTDEAAQTLSVTAVGSAVGGTVVLNAGNVEFTPALDFNGAASFVYTVTDNGTTNGAPDPQSDTATVSFSITAVNDAPSFAAVNPAAVGEDAGAQTVSSWASFTAGPADESSQTVLAYSVSGVTNPGLFSAGPSVGTDGTLSYTPAAGISGSSDFTVQVQDNGGTANGGVDLSATLTFTITVSDVNDQPSFTAASPAAVLEDAAAQTLAAWATFDQGAGDSGQAVLAYNVTGVTNAALFSAGPSIGTDGTLSFTPAINANGSSDFTVTVQDNGGTAAGGVDTSVAQTFTITVTAVNDAPGYTIGANQAPAQGSTGVQTVTGWATDISAGPADEAGQTLDFMPAEVTDPNDIVSGVSVAANGTLSYTLNGPAGTATISLTLSDDGGTANGGVDTSAALTFTITTLEPLADLAVSKFAQYAPGDLVVWDVVVENLGPGPVTDAQVTDTLPAGISGATWTCAVLSGTASCSASGSGDIDELVDMNAGSALLFTVTATLTTPDATISNTASVVAPVGVTDNVPGNNTATVVLTVPMFGDGFEGSGLLVQGELKAAAVGVWQAMPMNADDIADRVADFRGLTVASFTAQGQTLKVMARAVDGASEARLLRRDAKGQWTSTAWVTLRDGGLLQLQWLQQGDLLDARIDSLD
jgi:VCBS repeat-containing protein